MSMTDPSATEPVVTLRGATRLQGVLLAVAGLVGLLAAAQLTIDKFRILTNPGYLPACTLSDQVNCGTVMQSWQSTAFGFPNSLIGIAGFAVVITAGVVALAGARPARWFWWGLILGSALAALFTQWLVWQTAFDIRALCLYCAAVWAATLTILGTAVSIVASGGGSPASASKDSPGWVGWIPVVVLAWFGAMAVLVAWGLTDAA
jgi:uncharacterized membrane protein